MTFSEILTQYLSSFQITLSDLSTTTGISKSMLSRMKNGKKEPAMQDPLLEQLATGIAVLAGKDGQRESDAARIKAHLEQSLQTENSLNMEQIVSNLNSLIVSLDFRAGDLSRYLNFDPSYLSLIRSGRRVPADIPSFCTHTAEFVSQYCGSDTRQLRSIIGCTQEDLSTRHACEIAVYKWLTQTSPQSEDTMLHFLKKLDAFDLNEFIGALQFGEEAAAFCPADLPVQKNYYTQKGFMHAELDWLQAVRCLEGARSAILYSDMPIEKMSESTAFSKQWMIGVAILLKKGIHLDMIHQLDRQDSEMMLGLEAWIPLYMTGLVRPYYLPHNKNRCFHHLLHSSETAALFGEAIPGFYNDGRYTFSRAEEDIAYAQKRGRQLLSKAQPLMGIFRSDAAEQYRSFLKGSSRTAEDRHRNILSSPPLYTISSELLLQILERNQASESDIQKITAYVREYKVWAETVLLASELSDEIFEISQEDYSRYPVFLPLSDLFPEKEYPCTYEEYRMHLKQTKAFAEKQKRYTVSLIPSAGFRNIQIRIAEGKFVIISKEKSPTIHFVIHHPKLCSAIEHLTIPVVENADTKD